MAYSVSSAMAMMMSAVSFSLLLENFSPLRTRKERYVIWALMLLFFGFFGLFTSIFYTSRTTHHFSVYPILASMFFLAI